MQHRNETNASTERPATPHFLQQLTEARGTLAQLAPEHPEEKSLLRTALATVDAMGLFHAYRNRSQQYEMSPEREELANAVLDGRCEGHPDPVEEVVCRRRIAEARKFIANMGARTEGEQRGRWLLAALVDYIERAQEPDMDVDEYWAALDFFRAEMDLPEGG